MSHAGMSGMGGSLVSCLLLTLFVLPAAYTIWRRRQIRVGNIDKSLEENGVKA